MKIRLLYADREERSMGEGPFGWNEMLEATGTDALVKLMAQGDVGLTAAAKQALAHPLATATEVAYRQDAVRDALEHAQAVKHLFAVCQGEAVHAADAAGTSDFLALADVAAQHVQALSELAQVARDMHHDVKSVALRRFADEMAELVEEGYLKSADEMLREICRPSSALMSATLDPETLRPRYELRSYPRRTDWLRWKVTGAVTADIEDDAAAADRASRLASARRALAPVLWEWTSRMGSFFAALRDELGFYVAAINLVSAYKDAGCAWCLPQVEDVLPEEKPEYHAHALSYAEGGSFHLIADEISAKGISCWLAGGADETMRRQFLSAWGQAEILALTGFPVPAEELTLPVAMQVVWLSSEGKDVEEGLAEAGEKLSKLLPGSIVLWDEPFSWFSQTEAAELVSGLMGAIAEAGAELVIATANPHIGAKNLARRGVFHLRLEQTQEGLRAVPGRPRADTRLQDTFEEVFGERLDVALKAAR